MPQERNLDSRSLGNRLAGLSPAKREVLEQLLEQNNSRARRYSIPRKPAASSAPLSFAQERLWFLNQLVSDNAAYNECDLASLPFHVDVSILTRAVNEIVRRHDILRTTFRSRAGEPLQLIAPSLDVPVQVHDLRHVPAAGQRDEVLRVAREQGVQPFDLAKLPLLRAALVRLEDNESVFVLTVHHIVCDGWSMGIFSHELLELYKAFASGLPSPLSELPLQYADYAVWQRQRLRGPVLENHLNYWRAQLAGATTLQLPGEHPRSPLQGFAGECHEIVIPTDIYLALKVMNQREGVTLFISLLAAFLVLLHRHSGQDDVTVGTPTANRNRQELQGLMGFFANTLAIRVNLSGDPTFREVLKRVRHATSDAFAHEELPFEKLVEELRPERDLSRNPLFQVAFQLFTSVGAETGAPTRVSPIDVSFGIAKFDLTCALWEKSDCVHGCLEYRTELFDGTSVARMCGHFQKLLASIVADVNQPISRLRMLAPAEERELLVGWNDNGGPSTELRCLHQLFEAHAAATPDAVAATFGDEEITYGELNRRANQLAHYLRDTGAGPETLVGLCVERSFEMLVGVLGILKAGGAYVPLDPSYPAERLRFMIADAALQFLVTQERLVTRVPDHSATLIRLDADWNQIALSSTENPAGPSRADQLAYVIYTSGSTGQPKGVLVPHAGVCNVGEVQFRTFGFGRDDRILQFASLSFDASVCEMSLAWRAGATLCLASQHEVLPGAALVALLRKQVVSMVLLPPSALAALPEDDLPALRIVAVEGEAFSAELVARWSPNRRFFNLYGPTETTIFATVAECVDPQRPPDIGRPIANAQVYVLDPHGQPVPAGVTGELYIGGIGVTRGYLNQPELTAQKFVLNRFSGDPSARLYRTGDRVRWRTGGVLEFHGRLDHQVKIRGFRVELGEIEAVLGRHASVQHVAVLAREDLPGDKRLVAYVVPAAGRAVNTLELRRFLQERLPEYMVPSAFVALEALPLTLNGKVDRNALPAPGSSRPQLEHSYVAPRTKMQRMVSAAWRDVLHLERVGIHDNFFDLGGHSLLIIRLQSRLEDALQKPVSIVDLFRFPTIAAFAEHLVRSRGVPERPRPEPEPSRSSNERFTDTDPSPHVPATVRPHRPLTRVRGGHHG